MMRFALLILAILAATPSLAQNTAGTQSDVTGGATLDLSVSCAQATPTALCPPGSVYEIPIGNGQGVVGADITGLTGSGAAIMVDRSIGGSWSGRNLLVTGSAGAFASTVTQDSSFTLNSVASRAIRFRVSTPGVGSARIFASATANSSIVQFATSLPAGTMTLGGVNVVNTPAVTVQGPVNVTDAGGSLTVDGTVAVQGPVNVTDAGGSLTVDGTVAVQGPVNVTDAGGSLTVDGAVTVSNFPATQAVTGSVAVSNFPATQPISAASLPLPAGAATETTNAAISGKLPASLGSKTGATSLSVVPNSDTPFPIFDRGAANFITGQVAVGTTPTLIAAARTGRRVIVLYPTTNTTYYLSQTSTISTATAAPLGGGVVVTLPTSAAVYAQGAASLTIGFMELY